MEDRVRKVQHALKEIDNAHQGGSTSSSSSSSKENEVNGKVVVKDRGGESLVPPPPSSSRNQQTVSKDVPLASTRAKSTTTPFLNRHTRFPLTAYKKGRQTKELNEEDIPVVDSSECDKPSSINRPLKNDDIFLLNNAASSEDVSLLKSIPSENDLEQAFVGMISFAKLGFMQAPSCLQCAYSSTLKRQGSAINDTKKFQETSLCQNLVVWRRDANILIQFGSLKGNAVVLRVRFSSYYSILHNCQPSQDFSFDIMLLQCHFAKKLLSGGTCSGWKWNDETKKMEKCQ